MEIIASDKNQPPEPAWAMYLALVGVGVVSALLIVSVFLLTLPTIQKKRAEALELAIFNVLPDTSIKRTFALTGDESFTAHGLNTRAPGEHRSEVIYAGYDAHYRLVGLAIQAQGMGYQDTIRILYGYAPDRQAIIGMQVLESKETPGLGDKIEKDEHFLNNFIQLDVTLTEDGTAIKNPIIAVKAGKKTKSWQIDGITGATISSKAIADILKMSTKRWIPLVQGNLQKFSATGETHGDS